MADMILLVDTAVVVPVNLFPLLDDTDFKTRETAVAYNAAGMDLVWNFVTAAGATTQTAVTPTTGGVYDWTHLGDGIYTMEIPASGGGSINNDTEGFGWFTGLATGVLAWRSPVFQFSPANVVNSLVVGSDLLDVSVTQLAGVAQSLTDLKDFADDGYDPSTNKVQGVVLTDTVTTYTGNTPQTGDAFARLGAPAGASVSADVAAVKSDSAAILADTGTDGVVVAAGSKTGYSLTATTGLGDQTANITGNLSGSVGSVTGLTASNLDATVSSRLATAGYTAPDNASITAIKAKTDNLPSGVKKNTALSAFEFVMLLTSDHYTAATGLTVTAERSIDGGALGACANSVTEVSNGLYKIDLAASDLNGDVITLRFSAATADDLFITMLTEP